MEGSDCIIVAPTAGGKTEAVLFPSLTKIAKKKTNSVQILYLAPLKALLNDIEIRAKKYSEACGLHSFKWHGDVGQKKKINELKIPSQLLLTTPESLEAILLRKSGWELYFKNLEVIIIDEAHNFASSDRGSHLISVIERLEWFAKIKPQRIAVSATIGNPEDMLSWLAGKKRDKGQIVEVIETKQKNYDYSVIFFNELKEKPGSPRTYSLNRLIELLYLSLFNKKSIVFAQSRTFTEKIAEMLNKRNYSLRTKIPLKVRTHHSSVSKYYREEAEKRINMKKDLESGIDSIISTSTLELGIDIGDLDSVFQVGSLASSSSFLQRVGRTGRRKGSIQSFKGLCLSTEDILLLTAVVNLGVKKISEFIKFPTKAFHIMAHQLICLSLQNNGISPQDAWKILKNIYCFSKITEKQFFSLIDYMIEKTFFREVDGVLIVGEMTENLFLSSNWRKLFSVFDNAPLYEVWNEKNHVGNLDAGFVEQELPPDIIVLGGIEWEIIKIRYDARIVLVKKVKFGEPPKWSGYSFMDVPYETAQEVGKILFYNDLPPDFLDDEAKDGLHSAREKYKEIKWFFNEWIILKSRSGNIYLWTFAGDKINRSLGYFFDYHPKISTKRVNYKFIELVKVNKDEFINIKEIYEYIEKIKNENSGFLKYLIDKTKENYKIVKFSKFTKCLLPYLALLTIFDKAYDFERLFDELDRINIVYREIE